MLAALAAAVAGVPREAAAFAAVQSPPAATPAPQGARPRWPRRPGQRRRSWTCPPPSAARRSASRRGCPRPAAGRSSPPSCPASRSRGAVRSSKPTPTSITSSCAAASRPPASGCRTTTPPEQIGVADFKRLWATNFLDDLVVRGPRRPLRQRGHRQGGRLQHGGAPAGQDCRLRRHQEGRAVEDRREAEEEGSSPSGSTRSSTRA